MEFTELEKVNGKMTPMVLERKDKKTGTVTKKNYYAVNQRIMAFRELFPDGSIQTEIISLEGGVCTIKASAYDEGGVLLATGHAQEKEKASYINETSFIENCETSAVGRCLGFLGIGATESIASKEEVENKIKAEEARETNSLTDMKKELIELWVKAGGNEDEKFDEWFSKNTADKGLTGETFGLMKAILCKRINDNADKKKGAEE